VTEALELLKAALKTDPSNAEGHNNMGVLYYKQNKFELAQGEYLEAIKLRVHNPEAHSN
jgi:superkiller protein 3